VYKSIVFLALVVCAVPVFSQLPAETQRAEMKNLAYMIGKWQGTGWIERDGQRQTFAGSETLQSKLGGIVLLVEGSFTGKVVGGTEEVPVHETLGIISYDEQAKTYRFRSYLATGRSGEYELQLMADGWQWGFQFPQGRVRYTFTLSGKNDWFEIGEFSQDGQTWRKFFEMTLKRS